MPSTLTDALARAEKADADYQETIERLQALCDKYGCEPGSNRFDWLDERIAAGGREERLRTALSEARDALRWIANREDLTFAECSVAEEIVGRARDTAVLIDAALSQPAREPDQATAMRDLKHGNRDYSGDLPEKENDRG